MSSSSSSSSGARRLDPDSTLALLTSDLPSVPNYPPEDDDSEEEVFFGERSAKERNGKFSKFNGRPTLDPEELTQLQRRSWQVRSKDPEEERSAFAKLRERVSLFSVTSSIDEEEKEVDESHDDSENLPPTPPPKTRTSPSKSPGTPKQVTFSRKPEVVDLSEPFKELNLDNQTPGKGDSRPFRESIRSRSPLNSSGRISHVDVLTVGPISVDDSEDQDTSLFDLALSRPSRPHDDSISSNFSLNSSTSSNWFNNTHDEMVLFEKFGDKYDEVVAAMSVKEKRDLKKEVSRMEAKSAHELLGVHALEDSEIYHEEEEEPEEDEDRTPVLSQPPTPKPRTMTPQKAKLDAPIRIEREEELPFTPRVVQSQSALKMLRDELALALTPEPKTPTKQDALHSRKASNNVSPVAAEKVKVPAVSNPLPTIPTKLSTPLKPAAPPVRLQKGATPSKLLEKNLTPSKLQHKSVTPKLLLSKAATPSKLPTPNSKGNFLAASGGDVFKTPNSKPHFSYLRPTSASKHRASPKKDLVTNEVLDISVCARHGYAHGSPFKQPERRKLPCSVDLNKIVSPVGQYIREHPAPPLIRQVRPSKNRHLEEDALAAAIASDRSPRRDENTAPGGSGSSSAGRFAALPEAVYKSSRVALEKEVSGDSDNRKAWPKAFGKVDNVEALVVRHVGRERVPPHLRLTEEDLQTGMSCPISSSPHAAMLKFAQNRDSMAPNNESLMEMSIREVKKVTMGGGGGKN